MNNNNNNNTNNSNNNINIATNNSLSTESVTSQELPSGPVVHACDQPSSLRQPGQVPRVQRSLPRRGGRCSAILRLSG